MDNELDPPVITAVSNAVPPTHTSLFSGVTLTVASSLITTVTLLDTGFTQPEGESVMTTRYLVVDALVVGTL